MPLGTVVVSFAGERRQVNSGTTVEQFLANQFGKVPQRHPRRPGQPPSGDAGLPAPGVPGRARGRAGDLARGRGGGTAQRRVDHARGRTRAVPGGPARGRAVARRGLLLLAGTGRGLLTPQTVASIARRMDEICSEDRPLLRRSVTLEEAEAVFRAAGEHVKLALLATHRSSTVPVLECGTFIDLAHGPVAPSAGRVRGYAVVPYEDGLLLRFPRNGDPAHLPPLHAPAQAVRVSTGRPGGGTSCSASPTSAR